MKASDLFLAVAAYQQLAEVVDCPLHLGITEAGGLIGGTVKSSIGMGSLLWFGIGDTIRVSLSRRARGRGARRLRDAQGARPADPAASASCRARQCARQQFRRDPHRREAGRASQAHLDAADSLSVLGCVVNGPGEARETDIGVTGGGNGKHMIYLSGITDHTIQNEDMVDHVVKLVEAKAAEIEAHKAAAEQAVAAE